MVCLSLALSFPSIYFLQLTHNFLMELYYSTVKSAWPHCTHGENTARNKQSVLLYLSITSRFTHFPFTLTKREHQYIHDEMGKKIRVVFYGVFINLPPTESLRT